MKGGDVTARMSSFKRDSRTAGGGVGYCLLAVEGEREEEEVVGYARIEPSNAAASVDAFGGGKVGIVTSVVIAAAWRGAGLGGRLMCLLEQEAQKTTEKQSPFHFLYLWASEDLARDFYGRVCGFTACKKELSLVSALDHLEEAGVDRLEDMLSRKMMSRVRMTDSACAQPIMSPMRDTTAITTSSVTDSTHANIVTTDKTVWMSKRIRFEESALLYYSCTQEESEEQVKTDTTGKGGTVQRQCSELGSWRSALHKAVLLADLPPLPSCQQEHTSEQGQAPRAETGPKAQLNALLPAIPCTCPMIIVVSRIRCLPWTQQVGPSCGLQAVRMVSRAALARDMTVVEESFTEPLQQLVSPIGPTDNSKKDRENSRYPALMLPPPHFELLPWAIEQGYSSQGEIFDIHHLALVLKKQISVDLGSRHSGTGIDVKVQKFADLGREGVVRLLTSTTTAGFIILPYDRNRKHLSAPCCAGGLSAHYAVMCGVMTRTTRGGGGIGGELDDKNNINNNNDNIDLFYNINHGADDIWLVALQSMSPAPVVATFAEWANSNLQLFSDDGQQPDEVAAVHLESMQQFDDGGVMTTAVPCSSSTTTTTSSIFSAEERLRRRAVTRGWKMPKGGSNLGGNCVVIKFTADD